MDAGNIRMIVDGAIKYAHSIQCNCKNSHSFEFIPIEHSPTKKNRMYYGLLVHCDVPIHTDDGFDEFVYDDEWFYRYSTLSFSEELGVLSLAKIDEKGRAECTVTFPLKDVKDIITRTLPGFDWECRSIKLIEEVCNDGC